MVVIDEEEEAVKVKTTVSDSVEIGVPHNMYNAAVRDFEHDTATTCGADRSGAPASLSTLVVFIQPAAASQKKPSIHSSSHTFPQRPSSSHGYPLPTLDAA